VSARETAALKNLRVEVKSQRRLIVALAKALHLHARTDVAPDACLPSLERLIARAKGV
jgi:hypothetical protein